MSSGAVLSRATTRRIPLASFNRNECEGSPLVWNPGKAAMHQLEQQSMGRLSYLKIDCRGIISLE